MKILPKIFIDIRSSSERSLSSDILLIPAETQTMIIEKKPKFLTKKDQKTLKNPKNCVKLYEISFQ